MRIYLDLDCTLFDFIGAVARRFGLTDARLRKKWTPGEYDVVKPLSKWFPEMTTERFWATLDGDAEFWAKMPPLSWFEALLTLAEAYDPQYRLLTSPSRCPWSWFGKASKIARHFSPRFLQERTVLTSLKSELSKPGRVLIDDSQANCDAWNKEGGTAILFPSIHNRLHEYEADPLYIVKQSLLLAKVKEEYDAPVT